MQIKGSKYTLFGTHQPTRLELAETGAEDGGERC
jgi:hypothetical protein